MSTRERERRHTVQMREEPQADDAQRLVPRFLGRTAPQHAATQEHEEPGKHGAGVGDEPQGRRSGEMIWILRNFCGRFDI